MIPPKCGSSPSEPAAIQMDSSRSYNGRKVYDIMIAPKYLDLIERRVKTVEGRVNKPKYSVIQKGDIIKFINCSNKEKQILCRVDKKVFYKGFREMLEGEGLENCLPGVSSIESGVSVYYSFPDYEQDEKLYQVTAFKITYINNKLSEEVLT